MTVREYCASLLEKSANAAEGGAVHESIPQPDNVESSTTDHDRIMEDSRSYLHSLFSRAGAVQSSQTAEFKKMFSVPQGTITSNPLIKVAFRKVFFQSLEDASLLKTASSIHREIVFNAFADELEKIALTMPPMAPQAGKSMMQGGMGSQPAMASMGSGMASGSAPRL